MKLPRLKMNETEIKLLDTIREHYLTELYGCDLLRIFSENGECFHSTMADLTERNLIWGKRNMVSWQDVVNLERDVRTAAEASLDEAVREAETEDWLAEETAEQAYERMSVDDQAADREYQREQSREALDDELWSQYQRDTL